MPAAPRPLAVVGEVAYLRVLAMDARGAWLDPGRPGDLLLPRKEIVGRLREGGHALVYVHLDEDDVPVATMHLNDFIDDVSEGLAEGDRVTLVIEDRTDLGVNAVVNHKFWGLLYANELFKRVARGDVLEGWVKAVREDKRLDLALAPPGYASVDPLTDVILARLKAAGGFLPYTDKSSPEQIQRDFEVSKKKFKQAVGALYKRERIVLEDDGIRLVPGREGR